jgi:hypothetical protein
MAGPPSIDDFVVLPDHGPPPQARIKGGAFFQEGLDPDDVVVAPNGYALVLVGTNGPNTYVPNPTGVPWPPAWWPTQRVVPSDFAPGVPTVPAPFLAPISAPIGPQSIQHQRVEQPTGPEPRNRPRR